MLRFNVRVTVYKKNEENNRREVDFPSSPGEIAQFAEEIERHLQNVHLIDNEGEIFILGVSNITVIP
jgi:hypothetical protein